MCALTPPPQAIVDVIASNGWLSPALAAMEMSQMTTQASRPRGRRGGGQRASSGAQGSRGGNAQVVHAMPARAQAQVAQHHALNLPAEVPSPLLYNEA